MRRTILALCVLVSGCGESPRGDSFPVGSEVMVFDQRDEDVVGLASEDEGRGRKIVKVGDRAESLGGGHILKEEGYPPMVRVKLKDAAGTIMYIRPENLRPVAR